MAYDLWDELTVRQLPSWETFAGHSGQRALIVRNHSWTVSRKVRATPYGAFPSCAESPDGPNKGILAV